MPKDLIIEMARSNVVDGLKIASQPKLSCEDCALNRCRRASHPSRSSPRATKPCERIHMDIVGPVKPQGMAGELYILMAIDEFSGTTSAVPIRVKSEVTGLVRQLIYQCETQTGNEVIELVTDNGLNSLRIISNLLSRERA